VSALLRVRQVEVKATEVPLLRKVVVDVGVVADQLRERLDDGYL
jgi:hypothetical protein